RASVSSNLIWGVADARGVSESDRICGHDLTLLHQTGYGPSNKSATCSASGSVDAETSGSDVGGGAGALRNHRPGSVLRRVGEVQNGRAVSGRRRVSLCHYAACRV